MYHQYKIHHQYKIIYIEYIKNAHMTDLYKEQQPIAWFYMHNSQGQKNNFDIQIANLYLQSTDTDRVSLLTRLICTESSNNGLHDYTHNCEGQKNSFHIWIANLYMQSRGI